MIENRLGYWATIEHYRNWLATDGSHLAQIKAEGQLSLPIARRIAQEYSVARTVMSVTGSKGAGLDFLVDDINKTVKTSWTGDMKQNAELCRKIAERHKKRCLLESAKQSDQLKGRAPYSGVSKLVWFLKPVGWAMYDSLAQRGLTGSVSMLAYFTKLSDLDFEIKAQRLTSLCSEHRFPLYGERIIDKFLLLRGSSWRRVTDTVAETYLQASVDRNRYFLGLLPDKGKALEVLARRIADELPDKAFWTEHAERASCRAHAAASASSASSP